MLTLSYAIQKTKFYTSCCAVVVGIYHLIARVMGGTGEYGRYAYLMAAIQAPISILTSLLGFIPFLGGCLGALLGIYTLVLTYFATKVEYQLSSGQAIAVILIPIVALFLLAVCVAVGIAGVVLSLNGGQ